VAFTRFDKLSAPPTPLPLRQKKKIETGKSRNEKGNKKMYGRTTRL
jgi:hypothetical protein